MRKPVTSVELLRRLVAFDTTSRNSNLELIEFVRGHLSDLGVASELVHDPDQRKANLYATLGPAGRAGIALSGHTDVVPVDGQRWSSDPFTLAERDGRFYGRGSADMKGFIACCLALAPEFLARPAAVPLHLVLSYDEEVGCLGVRSLLQRLATRTPRPRMCIVGEPTSMQVVRAHKGKSSFRARVRGRASHSGLPHLGVNAVEAAAEAIAHLGAMARRCRDRGPTDAELIPPYTTVHTGVVRGGEALNIVPAECSFEFEFRNLPQTDNTALLAVIQAHVREHIEPRMHAVDPATGFEWQELSSMPALDTPPEAEVVRLIRRLTGANTTGKVSFGTEGGLFAAAGMPAVICGPGSIEQAHKPDEFIAGDQIERCEAFLRRLFDHCWEG